MHKVIVVLGPTAAGKTSIALQLAGALDAEIICADSIQAYKALDIGSFKPSLAEQRKIKHHLLDFLELKDEYNCAIFAEKASAIIAELASKNKALIICGGSMLYIKTLLYGIAGIPKISAEVQKQIAASKLSTEQLQEEIFELTAERPKYIDRQRLLRAYSVALETGQSISQYQKQHGFNQLKYNPLYIGVGKARPELYERINARVLTMIDQGLIAECQAILNAGYNTKVKSLNSIGYKQVFEHLEGQLGFDEMVQKIQQKTRNYAKRQLTWYKQNTEINWYLGWDDSILSRSKEFLSN